MIGRARRRRERAEAHQQWWGSLSKEEREMRTFMHAVRTERGGSVIATLVIVAVFATFIFYLCVKF